MRCPLSYSLFFIEKLGGLMGVRHLWCITVDSLWIKIYILQQKKKKLKENYRIKKRWSNKELRSGWRARVNPKTKERLNVQQIFWQQSNTSFIKPIVRHETLRMRAMSKDDFYKFSFSTSELFMGDWEKILVTYNSI